MKYYESLIPLNTPFEERNSIHRVLDKKIRDSFFRGEASPLRQANIKPRYRFAVLPTAKDTVACVVRSEIPLGLPGEQEKDFVFHGGQPFDFRTFMCLNTKQGSKLVYNPDNFEALVEKKLERFGIEKPGLFIDTPIKIPVQKGRHHFFLVGAWVDVSAFIEKEQAFRLMVEGVGIKAVYGFGLVF